MVKHLFSLLFLLIVTGVAYSQTFYVTLNGRELKRVTIKSGVVTEQDIQLCDETSQPMTIAIYKDTFYSTNGPFQGKGTINGNELVNCAKLSGVDFITGNSLTVDANGFFYAAYSDQLWKIDVSNGATTYMGSLPYVSAGDLTFLNGFLYMASTQGIVKIDINNTAASELIIPSDLTFWGITTAAANSTQNKVYAMAIFDNSTTVYELDLDNKLLGKIVATLPYTVNDAASYEEDGSPSRIEITEVKQLTNCDNNAKGTLQVICREQLSDYTYMLNGVTNSSGIFNNVSSGPQTITVKSATETKSISFTASFVLQKPNLSITKTNPICKSGGQITINATNSETGYKISYKNVNYDLNHTFTDLNAGTYHFSILNENGCEVDKRDIVLTQDLCKISVVQTLLTEECDNPGKGKIEVITLPHDEIYTYSISNVSNTTGVFTNVSAGMYNANIVSSNADTKSLLINVPDYNAAKPAVVVNKIEPACGILGSINIELKDTDDTKYTVKYNSTIYPLTHVFNLGAGSYHFVIIKPNGCIFEERDVTLKTQKCSLQIVDADINEECNAPGKAIITAHSPPHNDEYTYTLNGILSNHTGLFNNVVPGNYVLKINNADDEKIINLQVPDYDAFKPTIQIVTNDVLCDASGSVQLMMSVTNTSGYKIRFNNNLYSFDQIFKASTVGNYHFEIIKPNGCLLKVIDVPIKRSKCEIELLAPTVEQQCDAVFKGNLTVNSKPHSYVYTYTIDNKITNNTGLFSNIEAGNHNVVVSSTEDYKEILVIVPDYKKLSPAVSIEKNDPECDLQGSVKFQIADDIKLYKVRFESVLYNLDHQFKLSEGGYDFTILKSNGCILDNYHVDMTKLPCDLMVLPTAFTPNNDGRNDIFEPNQGSDAENYNLKVFTRSGMLVFTSNALRNGWHGEYNGQPVPVGVYYWVVSYNNNTGKNLKKSGSVTLIR